MNKDELQRRLTIGYYNLRIWMLDLLMRLEDDKPITKSWKYLARRQGQFIQKRNHLRTPAEIRKIEKRRGLS